jgi:hypothetical protein
LPGTDSKFILHQGGWTRWEATKVADLGVEGDRLVSVGLPLGLQERTRQLHHEVRLIRMLVEPVLDKLDRSIATDLSEQPTHLQDVREIDWLELC